MSAFELEEYEEVKTVGNVDQTQDQASQDLMEVDETAQVSPSKDTQSDAIEPEDVLTDPQPRPDHQTILGKRPRSATREAAIDLLLLKISDQYKLKKRHLQEARYAEVNLKNLIQEVQERVYGYELFSEDDQ